MNICWKISISLMFLVLTACADLSVAHRQQTAEELAFKAGWSQQTISTSFFPLRAYHPPLNTVSTLTIYIEGDGLAWITRTTPSSDPTPLNPLALKLAIADNRNHAVYLARPCQFVRNEKCERGYWTSARFGPQVIESVDEAIGKLKAEFKAKHIQLVGYSGGGAVAALVAARRNDVTLLITVAGNLDHKVWTTLHGISPLSESLNAADFWQQLVNIPQILFVGGKDHIVPLAVAESYRQKFPVNHRPEIKVINSADHHCCWVSQWPALLKYFNQKDEATD